MSNTRYLHRVLPALQHRDFDGLKEFCSELIEHIEKLESTAGVPHGQRMDTDAVYLALQYGHKPKRVEMVKSVFSEIPAPPYLHAKEGEIYEVATNPGGAVSAIFENGARLGLKPDEFRVIEWVKNY